MKKYLSVFCLLCASFGTWASTGEGCGVTITEVGTTSEGFKFTSPLSNSLSYLADNDQVAKIATVAYLTGAKVCVYVDKYTNSSWHVNTIHLEKANYQN